MAVLALQHCIGGAHPCRTGLKIYVAEACQLTSARPCAGAALGSSEAQAGYSTPQESMGCTGADDGPVHSQQQPDFDAPSLPHSKAPLLLKASTDTAADEALHSSNADAAALVWQPEQSRQQEHQACSNVTSAEMLLQLSKPELEQLQEAPASRGETPGHQQAGHPGPHAGPQTGYGPHEAVNSSPQAEEALSEAGLEDLNNRQGTDFSQEEAFCDKRGQQLLQHSLAGRWD